MFHVNVKWRKRGVLHVVKLRDVVQFRCAGMYELRAGSSTAVRTARLGASKYDNDRNYWHRRAMAALSYLQCSMVGAFIRS